MLVRKIKREEIMEARNIAAVCFEWPHDTKGKSNEDYVKELEASKKDKDENYFMEKWAAFNDNNEMMSCFSVLPYVTEFDGSQSKMSGIGCVCTYPQHRRKGAVRECFNKGLVGMYNEGFDFSYLYAFSEAFYGNYGYCRSSTAVLWDFDMMGIPDYRFDGNFLLYRGDDNISDFEIAYNKYAKKLNLMIYRDEFDWDKLKNANPFKIPNYAFLYKNAKGEPCGYVIFKKTKEHNRIVFDCSELVFDDFTTLKAIMSFIRTYASDYDIVRFAAPSCYALEYFCKDYQQYKSSYSFLTNGMVRVINVNNILMKAKYKGEGSISLNITDNQIKENNKLFIVTYKNGKAIDVKEDIKDSKEADIDLNVSVFSGAIVGNYDVSDFEFMENIKINTTSEKVSQIFYKKPCFISNYF